MSQTENSQDSLETQTLFSAMTKEDTNSFEQQQRYQEQQNTDNFSEEISSSTELMEIPQLSTQLSSTDSTISSPPALINSSDSNSSNSPTLSSSGSTQLDFDTPTSFNSISFLNTVHQKLKTLEAPVYSYSHDSATGHFYCQVNFCGQIYENKIARPKKQNAKEEAASVAVKDLSSRMPEIADLVRQYGNNKNNNPTIKRPITQPPELVSKSLQWYNRQLAHPSKRPCVLLLEFCQMHRIGYPVYTMRDDGRGYYLFDCTVDNRVFKAELSFWKKNDAKDHTSTIAFDYLYREFVEKEQREIPHAPYGMPLIAPPIPSPPPPHPPNIAYSPIYPNVPNVIDRNNYGYFC